VWGENARWAIEKVGDGRWLLFCIDNVFQRKKKKKKGGFEPTKLLVFRQQKHPNHLKLPDKPGRF
jgi:hypothetical protein